MLPQKLRDLAFLQLELRQQHAKQGLVRQRLKRSFGVRKANSSPGANTPDAIEAPTIPGAPDDIDVVEEVGEELAGNRGYDSSDDEDSELTDLNKEDPSRGKSFTSLMEVYEDEHEEDHSHGIVVEQESNRPTMPRTVRVFFGQKRHIPIEKVFNWDVEDGWDSFWFEGIKNCRQEMEFYELASAVEGVKDKGDSDKQSFDGKGASQPIVIAD